MSGAERVRMRATKSTSTRGSEVEGKTIEASTWFMEVERKMRFLVIENSMTRNAISASTFPGHPRCNSIPSCWVSMLRGVRFCSSLHLLSNTFGAEKHAPNIRTCILYGVMIPYGKCLVNYAQGRVRLSSLGTDGGGSGVEDWPCLPGQTDWLGGIVLRGCPDKILV